MLSNRLYDILKYIALIAIPALVALVLTVGKIWDLPYYDNIGATISAFGVFLGALLGVSTKNYRAEREQMNYNTDEDNGLEVIDYEDTDNDTEEQ